MASGLAVVDFGDFPGSTHASVAVAQQAEIPSDAIVRAWIDRRATTDHSADEHTVERFVVTAGDVVAGTGFTIHVVLQDTALPPSGAAPMAWGEWGVAWEWSRRV
jgi:hypothetical protein